MPVVPCVSSLYEWALLRASDRPRPATISFRSCPQSPRANEPSNKQSLATSLQIIELIRSQFRLYRGRGGRCLARPTSWPVHDASGDADGSIYVNTSISLSLLVIPQGIHLGLMEHLQLCRMRTARVTFPILLQ
ncbi:hypothetical protein CIRG_09223 [Coccidioides immitis RMSCC 2394]|uniref:Uncharacterized protein n=1 Tax=Coccidioides immitis RMSCC 2394 TaxID=404692 RepID=A0A0J6YRT5_COCIT|nr:hypothetical protein CIRG_09223 [Coccidioides immitis RMSCC 2394]